MKQGTERMRMLSLRGHPESFDSIGFIHVDIWNQKERGKLMVFKLQ